eukprot:TRINITY_DN3363_c0_g1_i1.p3 TRINITY_DN3363_c0_g1~~TRINITY_DN3363_c0_g1_i1.p3  ORF type:complete len:54 (-),score=8.08 TRINITY_DN3363_c0_g1_i1:75-236(-)
MHPVHHIYRRYEYEYSTSLSPCGCQHRPRFCFVHRLSENSLKKQDGETEKKVT